MKVLRAGQRGDLVWLVVALSALSLLGSCTPKPNGHVQVAAPAGRWISIFNGRNLDGWTVKIAGEALNDNYRGTFRVQDGVLKVSYENYDTFGDRFGSLFYNQPLSNYWLRVEYRFVGKRATGAPRWAYKNSGLQLLSQSPATMGKLQQFPVSVEFDLVGGWYVGSRPTGDVCQNGTQVRVNAQPVPGQCSKLSDITIRDDQWVTALAEVHGGTRVRQIINGNLILEYTDAKLNDHDPDARRLLSAGAGKDLTSGYISLQSNGHPVEFRRIEILPLDEPTGGSAAAATP
jgi:hypothetical protein